MREKDGSSTRSKKREDRTGTLTPEEQKTGEKPVPESLNQKARPKMPFEFPRKRPSVIRFQTEPSLGTKITELEKSFVSRFRSANTPPDYETSPDHHQTSFIIKQ